MSESGTAGLVGVERDEDGAQLPVLELALGSVLLLGFGGGERGDAAITSAGFIHRS
jgi:hypothetical protein